MQTYSHVHNAITESKIKLIVKCIVRHLWKVNLLVYLSHTSIKEWKSTRAQKFKVMVREQNQKDV